MEAVGYSSLSSKEYHLVHHIATSCHHESDVRIVLEHLCSSFHEIFRTFLHGDATEERYHLVLRFVFRHIELLGGKRCHGIVNGRYLCRVDAVVVNHSVAGKIAYRYDVVGIVHAVLLDAENGGIGFPS